MAPASSEPSRVAPSAALSTRMSNQARKDTKPEVALRSALHAQGLRFRKELPVPGNARRRIDIAFTRQKVAVFVDGCFWHQCPEHGRVPATNTEWWTWKLTRNVDRDRDTTSLLERQGWRVVRLWEHEPLDVAVHEVVRTVKG